MSKTITLYGIWCSPGHSGASNGGFWVKYEDAYLVDDAVDICGLAAFLTKKKAIEDKKEGASDVKDSRHEHVAPIARLTTLPPPKIRSKKEGK